MIILGLLMLGGLFFWPYLGTSRVLGDLARQGCHRRPVDLFVYSLFALLIWALIGFGFYYLLERILEVSFKVKLGLYLVTAALGGASGYAGWIVMVSRYRDRIPLYENFDRKHAVPRLQCWMQDLLIAVLALGGLMALPHLLAEHADCPPETVYALSVSYFLAAAMGLYFALDVCRRSRRMQRPGARALLVACVVLVTGAVFLIPVWMAWGAWREALFRGQWSVDQEIFDGQQGVDAS